MDSNVITYKICFIYLWINASLALFLTFASVYWLGHIYAFKKYKQIRFRFKTSAFCDLDMPIFILLDYIKVQYSEKVKNTYNAEMSRLFLLKTTEYKYGN